MKSLTSRTIKFRYRYTDCKNWISKVFDLEQIAYGEPFEILNNSPELENYSLVGKDQFTGLTDKDGKEIYEGDIITCSIIERENYDDYESDKPLVVSWAEECAGFYPFIKASQWRSEVYDVVKIGTIFETPELIEGDSTTLK